MAQKDKLEIRRQIGDSIKSNNGFSTITLVAVLPIVLSIFAFLGFHSLDLTSTMAHRHLCRTTLLNAQNTSKNDLVELLGLNPLARSLELEKRRVLANMARSPHPVVIAALTARLTQIHIKKLQLSQRQQRIIQRSNRNIKLSLEKLKTELRRLSLQEGKKWRALAHVKTSFLDSKAPTLSVRPTAMSVLAPTYEPLPNFEKIQSTHIFWRTEFISSGFWKQILWKRSSRINGCVVSIKKGVLGWQEVIKMDRY